MTTIPKTKKDFAWVTWGPKEIKDAITKGIDTKKEIYKQIKAVPDAERTFENTLYALEISGRASRLACSRATILQETSPSKDVRDQAHRILDDTQKELIDILYDEQIYKAVKYYAEKNAPKEKLAEDEKLLLEDTLRGYKRMGFDLSKAKRESLKKNLKELSELENRFAKNINDYEDHIVVTDADLEGLPDTYKKNLKTNKKGGYLVSLQYPEIGPFMQLSPSAEKRKELGAKNLQKGGPANVKLLSRIIRLRSANAKLLGYSSHAHYVIEENMAKTPTAVWKLIYGVNKKSRKPAQKELAELLALKREETGDAKAVLEFYDIAYYANKLQKMRFSVDTEEIRKYFPFTKVKEGVFATYSKLFSVTFKKLKGFPVIHPDVELYEVRDKKNNVVGYFSMDLYPRDGKFSHAAAFGTVKGRTESFRSDEYHAPYSAMVANFAKPLPGKPSLLSHGEVETFFHEFGHIMHGVLTRARYASQAGTNVAIDFVEVPSQMFENWTWDPKVIASMSEYYQKPHGPMPAKMMRDLIASKKFMIGYYTLRQTILSMLDMSLHWGGKAEDPNKLYIRMVKENTGIDLPKDAIFTAGFGHLMGYDAGYYSYMWSLVYAHDIFSRFKKEGLFNAKTGADLKKFILEKGSSTDEMKQIVAFLGRKPNNKAFLEEMGLK